MSRPEGVPRDWIRAACAGCNCEVWYPPEAQAECLKRGTGFLPVCSAACAQISLLKCADIPMTDEERAQFDTITALRKELRRTPGLTLELESVHLLQIVCLLQLALLHPSMEGEGDGTRFVRELIQKAREIFKECPEVLKVIDRRDPAKNGMQGVRLQ